MRLLVLAVLLHAGIAVAQVADLGHRLPGGIGLDAGTQPEQGLYLADRFVWFASDRVHDRNGHTVPIENLDIDAFANAFGASGTLQVGDGYLDAAFSIPVTRVSLSADDPQASVDRLGLGDIYVQPFKLGVRGDHFDAVGGYSFYAPTSEGARSGLGRPQWSHQLSAGGTFFFDDVRGWRASALASYTVNGQKQGVDITRGDTIQIQGGVGGRVLGVVDLGLAGYALWQTTDDRGADLPPQVVGARERAFGLGPEVDVRLRALRSRLTARFEWDIDGEARPVGTILVAGLAFYLL